jgi:hypothetical protein
MGGLNLVVFEKVNGRFGALLSVLDRMSKRDTGEKKPIVDPWEEWVLGCFVFCFLDQLIILKTDGLGVLIIKSSGTITRLQPFALWSNHVTLDRAVTHDRIPRSFDILKKSHEKPVWHDTTRIPEQKFLGFHITRVHLYRVAINLSAILRLLRAVIFFE